MKVMKTILGGALVASLAILGTPTVAGSALSAPITIRSFMSSPSSLKSAVYGDVLVTFVNETPTTATSVVFYITDGQGNEAYVNDVGTFTTGVMIRHDLQVPILSDNTTAQVAEVQFIDGTSWDNYGALPLAPRLQAPDTDN